MQLTECLGALIVHKFDQSVNRAVGISISTRNLTSTEEQKILHLKGVTQVVPRHF